MSGEMRPAVDWRDVAATIDAGVGVLDGETFVYGNDGLVDAFQLESRHHLVGSTWREYFGEAACERIEREALPRVRDVGHWRGSVVGPRTDGAGPTHDLSLVKNRADDSLLWIVHDVSAPVERDRHALGRFERRLIDAIDDILYVFDGDGDPYVWNQALIETTGYGHDEIGSMSPEEFVPSDQREHVPGLVEAIDVIGDQQVDVDIVTKDGETITHEFSGTTFAEPSTGELFRCGIARDITARLERERELERQRDELTTLTEINELVFEITSELTGTATRETVKQLVCDRLADSSLYESAWIGEPQLDGSGLAVGARAHTEGSEPPRSAGTSNGLPVGRELAARSFETREVNVETVQGVPSDRDVRSLLAVPLLFTDAIHGVLVIQSARPMAFSEREQAGFSVLGETVGFVLHAINNRKLLFADEVVELELGMTANQSILIRASETLNCTLSLDGYVAAADQWLLYVTVDGTSPDALVEFGRGEATVERGRVLTDAGNRGTVELAIGESTILDAVVSAGAKVRWARADQGVGRLAVDAPLDADTRDVLAKLEASYPGIELLRRTERAAPIAEQRSPIDVLDDLTDRQRTAIETAYLAGYFNWPRSSTAEDVATSLDISAPTLHAHMRKAQQALFAELFDRDPG